jgi:sec-independent protein translocase protein TatA
MGTFGIWQWIIILAIVLILFARPGKISGIMGDFGKGMNKFKSGLKEGDSGGDDDVIAAKPKAKKKKAAKKAKKKS